MTMTGDAIAVSILVIVGMILVWVLGRGGGDGR